MHVLRVRNVGEAWPMAIDLIDREGVPQETRAGTAKVVPVPVATVYSHPTERVLFDPVRDANPIFHHMESLWMLAGRDDATWLDNFVSDFSKRFAEDGGRMHGAYGKRWRDWFERLEGPGFGRPVEIDQLDEAVRLLREDPQSRQVVIGMWDPSADLGVPGLKDRPCNTQIYLRTDRQIPNEKYGGGRLESDFSRVLDMTVTCRSNDAVYGAYGANAVHMSVLQEYLAARIGVEVGTYTQFSNNLHMYDWSLDKVSLARTHAALGVQNLYPGVRRLVDHAESFDRDLKFFLGYPESPKVAQLKNSHFHEVAQPMWYANKARLERDWTSAKYHAGRISAPDWRQATVEWLGRRERGAAAKETRE